MGMRPTAFEALPQFGETFAGFFETTLHQLTAASARSAQSHVDDPNRIAEFRLDRSALRRFVFVSHYPTAYRTLLDQWI
jgi:hypothetical protein